MASRYQREFIGLVNANGQTKFLRAPVNFDWLHYPERLEHEGKTWQYFATYDATPYFREVRAVGGALDSEEQL